MREARKQGQKKVIRRQFVSPEVQNADTGPGLQVTEWVFVCAVNTRHTKPEGENVSEICIKCTWFSIFPLLSPVTPRCARISVEYAII